MRRLVNLFLSILLLGAVAVPAAAQSPTTAEQLLSGMVTEEVEPGVFRVTNDGVRDLPIDGDLVAGHDGSVWFVREKGFVRLGSPVEESYTFPKGWDHRFVVAPDGTVYVSGTRAGKRAGREVTHIHSLEDGKWKRRLRAPAFGGRRAS